MAEDSNRSELERQLADRKDSIERRIDELEGEIISTPAAIKSSIAKHPLVGVAGAVAAGLAVGLVFAGRKKKGSSVAPFHQRLVEEYIDAVGDDVRRRTRRGKSVEDAVRQSLRDRAPVIVYSPRISEKKEKTRGFFSQLADVALKTALGFAVKAALDFFTASLDLKELQQMLALEEEERRTGTGADAGAAGNGAPGSFRETSDVEGPSTDA